jgi:hypothetical protein
MTILILRCIACYKQYEVVGNNREDCSKQAKALGWQCEEICPKCMQKESSNARVHSTS